MIYKKIFGRISNNPTFVVNLQDSIMIFYKQLGEICDLRFGIAEQSSDEGEIDYVQISQFNDQGIRNDEKLSYLK
ncbi:MAG TPA: hypothetical protein PLR98_11980, partial [Chitinophagaceae bacterium]|nr:hypothetical protein [Chitinophagaceae bacterium]